MLYTSKVCQSVLSPELSWCIRFMYSFCEWVAFFVIVTIIITIIFTLFNYCTMSMWGSSWHTGSTQQTLMLVYTSAATATDCPSSPSPTNECQQKTKVAPRRRGGAMAPAVAAALAPPSRPPALPSFGHLSANFSSDYQVIKFITWSIDRSSQASWAGSNNNKIMHKTHSV